MSWGSSVAVGPTYSSSDPGITHQLVDREAGSVGELVLGRFYVQPQWVFDSINRREKCAEKDYALGETLPPHLSPFTQEFRIGEALEGEKMEDEEENEESENEAMDEEDEEEEGVQMGVRVGMKEQISE